MSVSAVTTLPFHIEADFEAATRRLSLEKIGGNSAEANPAVSTEEAQLVALMGIALAAHRNRRKNRRVRAPADMCRRLTGHSDRKNDGRAPTG